MPSLAATASASSTTSSRVSTRSPSASIPTLHRTGRSFTTGRRHRPSRQPWQQRREFFQAGQVVPGQQQVDVRRGRPSCRACAGRKSRFSPLCGFIQTTRWLSRESRSIAVASSGRITPVQAVGADHHDPAAGQAAPSPVPDEGVQAGRRSWCRPPSRTRPGRRAPARRPGRRLVQRPGDPGQPGAEAEHLDPRRGPLRRVGELEQVPGVVGHRAGHVQDQDQRPQPDLAPPPVQAGRARRACASTPAPSGAGPGSGPRARPRCGGCAAAAGSAGSGHDPAQRGQLARGCRRRTDLCRRTSASDAIRPRVASSSLRPPGPRQRLGGRDLQHGLRLPRPACAAEGQQSPDRRRAAPRKNRRNTAS